MHHSDTDQTDYGTGKKRLGTYVVGLILCTILTLLAFGVVMLNPYPRWLVFTIIYTAACIQFLVQVIFFLRLNTQTEQSKLNVMAILFTGLILGVVVFGSLWIMWRLNYNLS